MAVPVTDMIVSTAEDGVVAETTSIKDPNLDMTQGGVNNVLLEIISRFSGATYAGVATPETDPGAPLLKVFYLTTTAGEYANFGNLAAESGKLTVLLYNGSTWEKQVLDLPTSGGGSTVNVVQATGVSTTDVMSQKSVTDELGKRQMAPATVGEVGQVLTQTGPNAEDVSWQTPSGGGGTPVTVVQTTGDSTTDVMSQAAVTHELNGCLKEDTVFGTDNYGDGSITKEKLSEKSVSIDKIDTDVEYFTTHKKFDYTGSIAELYVYPDIIPEEQDLCCKGYDGGFYLRPRNMLWNARIVDIQSVENNVVEKIIAHSAGGEVEVGDVVGYVIFKDKQKFIDADRIDTSVGETLDKSVATTFIPWGVLRYYINGFDGAVIKDGTITQSKLDPSISFVSGIETGVDIYLPDELSVVEGDTLQIFWRSVIHAFNPYIFDIQSKCSVGKHYPRYFTYTPATTQVNNTYPLVVRVKKNDLSVFIEKSINIKVLSKPTSPSNKLNVLCIGASATVNGYWVSELKRRLVASDGDGTPYNPTGLGLSNIDFVGRRTVIPSSGGPVKLEATGGWRVWDYAGSGVPAYRFNVSGVSQLNIGDTYASGGATFSVTEINVTEGVGNIRCTYRGTPLIPASGTLNRESGTGDEVITYSSYVSESYNPFWNNETESLDFKAYADSYCDGDIGLQIWHCGVNDIASGVDKIPTIIESFRSILRAYRQDFPNGKVIISSVPVGSPDGGFGANYGAASDTLNYYAFLDAAQQYPRALSNLCKEEEFFGYTFYASALEEFDCENSYPYVDTPVNNRMEVTERLGTNAVHPIAQGSYMIADSIYRVFPKVL
ncbi:hypothetical protein [uncultured Alistipes sp.]|uniref:hypothetical protein n=1 Tax=uncultured Alistipes sp. TaxID=538949 RepID=UPI002666EE40|nr:hypothetical protein [uncultured Alistipes sp.]